ncbi:MAG TPA: hypothetical protein VGC42_25865 [Kofleriaceae bacterium]
MASGCSAPAECQAPTELAFDGTSITDRDAVAPGVQTDLHLTSSLAAGEIVSLELAGDDGTAIATMTAPADADGNVTFSDVSMPPPHVVLHATANATCGTGRAELAVDVGGGSACQLSLSPAPEANPYYAPTGVLSSRTDPDAATPGYQATVQVATLPGWTAELFETPGPATIGSDLPMAVSLGRITAAADGVASQAVSVADGELGFYAICRGPAASQVTSDPTTVIADTTPPACRLTVPLAPSTITRRYDTDAATAGWQLPVAAHADGDDVAGEPAELLAGPSGGTAAAIALPAIDGSGNATATATVAARAGNWDVALTVHDHAGNACVVTQTFDVEPEACDVTVAPTMANADADPRAGAQAALAVHVAAPSQVATTCSQQRVSVSCGIDSPTSFTDATGQRTLYPTLCSQAQCAVHRTCVVDAEGIAAGGAVIHTKTAIVVDFDNTK